MYETGLGITSLPPQSKMGAILASKPVASLPVLKVAAPKPIPAPKPITPTKPAPVKSVPKAPVKALPAAKPLPLTVKPGVTVDNVATLPPSSLSEALRSVPVAIWPVVALGAWFLFRGKR